MHQGSSLTSRKNGSVDCVFEFLVVGDYPPASWPSYDFVGRKSSKMSMRQWTWIGLSNDQTSKMSYIRQKISSYLICDRAKTRPIYDSRIRRRPSDDHFRPNLQSSLPDMLHIQDMIVICSIKMSFVGFTRKIRLKAVGQMPSVTQIQPQNAISGI